MQIDFFYLCGRTFYALILYGLELERGAFCEWTNYIKLKQTVLNFSVAIEITEAEIFIQNIYVTHYVIY